MSPSVKVLGTWMWDEKDIPNDAGSTTISLPDSLYEKLPSWTWKGEVQVVRPRWLLDIYGGAGDAHPLYIPQPQAKLHSMALPMEALSPDHLPRRISTTSFIPARIMKSTSISTIAIS